MKQEAGWTMECSWAWKNPYIPPKTKPEPETYLVRMPEAVTVMRNDYERRVSKLRGK